MRKQKEQLVLCRNYYPKEKGGVKHERMQQSSIDPCTDIWMIKGKSGGFYLQVFDIQKQKLVPYYPLNIRPRFPADRLARASHCPYSDLKSIKTGILERVAQWIPITAVALGILFIVMMEG